MATTSSQKIVPLEPFQAFSPGADLWLMPDLSQSKWARRIDWYLNFQFQRAKLRAKPQHSLGMNQVLQDSELSAPVFALSQDAPFMIASEDKLPNQATVFVPIVNSNKITWINQCNSIWKNFGSPKFRVFLPKEIRPDEFISAWKNITSSTVKSESTELDKLELISEVDGPAK
jgi:hypothetical protein